MKEEDKLEPEKNIPHNGESADVSFIDEQEESNPQAVIKKLRGELAASRKERDEYLAGWQRAKADFVNARKQEEGDRIDFVKFAEEVVIRGLLPALHSFNMLIGSKGFEAVPESWRKGIEQVREQFLAGLKQRGVSEFDPKGELFNPTEHESTSTVPVTDEKDDHRVIEVVQKGYKLNGKVIEPARVIIGEYKQIS